MLTALMTMKNGTALAFPFGSKVDVLANASDGGAFLDAIALYDSMIVKSILSQTLATEEGEHQARAAASIHQDVVDTIVRQSKRAVTRALTWDVLRPWVAYNYGIEAARTLTPKATLGHAEEPDLPVLWTAMASLQTSGYLAPSQYTTTDSLLNLPPRLPAELPPTEQEKQQQASEQLQMQLDAKAQQTSGNGSAPQKGAA
jgi:phage gp29-like protein